MELLIQQLLVNSKIQCIPTFVNYMERERCLLFWMGCVYKKVFITSISEISQMRVMTVLMPFTKKVYMTIRDTLYVYLTPTLLSSYLC